MSMTIEFDIGSHFLTSKLKFFVKSIELKGAMLMQVLPLIL